MARAPKKPTRRASRRNPTSVRGLSLISPTVPKYAAKWHRVEDWALESLSLYDVTRAPSRDARIEAIRGQLVNDLSDDEEAYERAVGLEDIEIDRGPSGAVGGKRRVMIRVLTWIPDKIGGIAYAPQWIVAGHGMSAHAASAALARYIRSYALAVSRGIESRRLIVTAIDVVWWTANESADYV